MNIYKSKNSVFGSGLTIKIAKEMQHFDCKFCSDKFVSLGIQSNFDNNKVIAWCCNKIVDVIMELNRKYNLDLQLPKGIFVEDFSNFTIPANDVWGFCNLQPTI